MSDDSDKPPTSKEEAAARCVRPPPEEYDPDELLYWSITMTLAWIIRRDLDAVRNERDDYRSECADWHPERPGSELLAESIADKERTGDARRYPDLHKKLQKRLEELIEAERKGKQRAWHRRHWPPSSWNGLCLRAISEAVLEPRQQAILSPQDARVELWQAAEEGGIIKATALEYESVKAYADDLNAGNPIEIPAIHWKYLKFDPSGRSILLGPGGRVYGDVRFRRLDVKKLWPKSPSLSGEPIEQAKNPEQTKLEPQRWLGWALKKYPKRKQETPAAHITRLHGKMENASNVTKVWKAATFRRRYYEET